MYKPHLNILIMNLNIGRDIMILVVKKSNIILIGLIFLLLVAIYSLNLGIDKSVSVTNDKDSEKFVIIDAGHGGEDPGATGKTTGIKEKDVNLKIAFKVKELLEQDGFKTLLTRSEDVLNYDSTAQRIFDKRKQDLLRRKKTIDESGADIVVSIHLNGYGDAQYSGAQTFFPYNSIDSQKLAINIQKSLREIVDPGNKREALVRGKPNELPIVILRDLKVPTAIVECGFLTNPQEEKKLADEAYQDKLAEAIKAGIVGYYAEKNGTQQQSGTE